KHSNYVDDGESDLELSSDSVCSLSRENDDSVVQGSCLKESELVLIVKAWNRLYPDPENMFHIDISKSDPPVVVKRKILQKFLSFCPDKENAEACWLKNQSLRDSLKQLDPNTLQLLDKFVFKPEGTEKRYGWLSTTHINEVAAQFQMVFDDFQWLGCHASDYYLRFGVLPQINKKCAAVVFNLDTMDESGSHWVAVFIEKVSHVGGQKGGSSGDDEFPVFRGGSSMSGGACGMTGGTGGITNDSEGTSKFVWTLPPLVPIGWNNRELSGGGVIVNNNNNNNKTESKTGRRIKPGGTYQIEFFDSTGDKLSVRVEGIKYFLSELEDRLNTITLVSTRKHQRKNTECGVYALYYIYQRLRGVTMDQLNSVLVLDKEMQAFRKKLFRPYVSKFRV
ncbi:UNVERIFIED_CONTAM: hypothetical protein HDU68_006416, partial [Siphonaria sp. JEL0065]